jgi:autotransporter-associated beta strand protein
LVVGGSTSTTFGGVINNGSGVVGLTKSGAGTLLLTGANGFTGGVTLNGGTLGAGSANALGSSGAISFGGGTLRYSASNTTDYSGRFSNAASQQYSIDTNGQNVTLASNLTSSGGSFTKLGAGGVTLSGNNSYSAGTLVSQGALIGSNSTSFGSGAIVLGDGNTGTNGILLMADATDNTTIANNITVANLGTGLVSIGGTNTGASSANAWTGTLTLNRNIQVFNDTPHAGGRTSFIGQITGSGGITVTQGRGRVTLQNTTNDFTGPVVVDSGATLQLDVASGLNEVIPNSAAVTVNGALNFASGGGTETIGSLSGSGTVSSVVAGTYRLVVGGSTSTTFGGVINNGSGVVGLTKSGAGTLLLTGANGFTGGVTLNGGTLGVGSANAIGSSGAISFGGGTLQYSASNTTDYSGRFSNAASQQYSIDTNGQTVTLASNLTSSGGSFTKLGVGTVRITGSNGYSGGTTISSGTVEVSAGGSGGGSAAGLGTGTVAVASGGQATYWLSNTGSHTIANAFSLSGGTLHSEDGSNNFAGLVTLASGASTISSRNEDTITLSGGLAGSGDVLFTQAGGLGTGPTFVLSGTGSNTGTVRVSGSANGITTKLQLANVNALQSATLDMATGDLGTVEFTVAGTNTYSLGGLQGARNLVVGSNSLSVGGNNQSTTYSGDLSASGLFTKVGSGTLVLSGSNAFTGATAVNGGMLLVNGQLGNTAVAVNASGMLGGSGTILGDVTVNSSGTLSPGNSPGVLTVGSLSLMAGSTTLMEITGTAAGLYDQIVATNNIAYGGLLQLTMSGSYANDTVFQLFQFGSESGDFSSLTMAGGSGPYAGLTFGDLGTGGYGADAWVSDWTTPSAPNGQRLVFYQNTGVLAVVPEPSTYAMALAGLACGGWQMWRRRRLRQAATLAA